ncbi:uncharacterized protein GlcG (DUF336 family) [Aneurinibacillus soli]|uniref:Uncharacterized protein n=2 Tax=Aneurinibacillus soli TaxID=1500254 RepID=A0A0U5AX13_9BACL|nr:heme-binding protein [Aneurinibacillus soli]PYE64324.1 uncharacterized protein GlcG (DUF336 family) [Aneurinibacillus soli]BAU28273.1 hypothetical protein CB4_02447 [Aneurinibacillus soli]
MNKYRVKKSITNELAAQMVECSLTKANELGVQINVAIVDESGHLVHFSRMDGAPILSIDISINKAYTGAAFGIPTHEWHPLISQEPALREGIVHTSRLVTFGGGYPITVEGEIIGAIGVSGGSTEQDMACCVAALELVEST